MAEGLGILDKALAGGQFAVHRAATKTVMSALLLLTGIAIIPLTYGAVTPGPNQAASIWVLGGLPVFDLVI